MKALRLFTFHLLYLGMSFAFCSGLTQAMDSVKTPAAQPQPSEGANIILFSNNHLTVEVKNIPLARLLQEIARQSGFTVVHNGSLDEMITIQFGQLPLEEGLGKILRRHNFAVEYVQQTDGEKQRTVRRPAKLWIFNKGEKSGPYTTLQAARASEDPGDPEAAEKIIEETAYSPETILREYKTKSVAKALLKDRDSGILELSPGDEIGGAEVKALIEKALENVDESIKGELLNELESIIENK